MHINTSKSFTFSFNNKSCESLHIDGVLINQSTSIWLLGIKLTSDMRLKEHGDYILKRVACGMATLRKLKCSGIEGLVLWRAYDALIFSHILYC